MKKVVLCLELYTLTSRDGEVGMIVSLPGREGTLVHRWGCRDGIPDPDQLVDAGAKIQQLLTDAYLLHGTGIQQKLLQA